MKNLVKMLKVLLIAGMICIPALLMAQGDPGGSSEPGDQVIDVPFDGGVTLLVAAGIGYGLKRARERKRLNKNVG